MLTDRQNNEQMPNRMGPATEIGPEVGSPGRREGTFGEVGGVEGEAGDVGEEGGGDGAYL